MEIKDQVEHDVKTLCGYCGREFEVDEIVIERTLHGRTWKFCNDECYHDFKEKLDFLDPEEK